MAFNPLVDSLGGEIHLLGLFLRGEFMASYPSVDYLGSKVILNQLHHFVLNISIINPNLVPVLNHPNALFHPKNPK